MGTTETGPPDGWSGDARPCETWRAGGSNRPARGWCGPSRPTVADWLVEGHVALAAAHLPGPAGADLKTVTKAVESGYQHVDYAQRQVLAVEYYAFLTRMRPGDLVCPRRRNGCMRAASRARPTTCEACRGPAAPSRGLGIAARPNRRGHWLADLRELQGTVVDLTDCFDDVVDCWSPEAPSTSPADDSIDPQPRPDGPRYLRFPRSPRTSPIAAHRRGAPAGDRRPAAVDRKQIVLYGPPGTGKTYLAMELAEHLVGVEDASQRQLVQFHPSYAYEDFFEGFRPDGDGLRAGDVRAHAGPLRRIATEAEGAPRARRSCWSSTR